MISRHLEGIQSTTASLKAQVRGILSSLSGTVCDANFPPHLQVGDQWGNTSRFVNEQKTLLAALSERVEEQSVSQAAVAASHQSALSQTAVDHLALSEVQLIMFPFRTFS